MHRSKLAFSLCAAPPIFFNIKRQKMFPQKNSSADMNVVNNAVKHYFQ